MVPENPKVSPKRNVPRAPPHQTLGTTQNNTGLQTPKNYASPREPLEILSSKGVSPRRKEQLNGSVSASSKPSFLGVNESPSSQVNSPSSSASFKSHNPLHGCQNLHESSHLFVTLWTVACRAALSMWFFRQEYWSGLPLPPPADLPDQGSICLSCYRWILYSLSHWGKPLTSVSVVYSFLSLAVFHCMAVLVCLSIPLLMDIWVVSSFWLFQVQLFWTFVYKSLYGHIL